MFGHGSAQRRFILGLLEGHDCENKPPPHVRKFVIKVRGVMAAFLVMAAASSALGFLNDHEENGVETSTIWMTVAVGTALVAMAAFMRRRWAFETRLARVRLERSSAPEAR